MGPVWLIYEDSLTDFLKQPRKRGPKGPHKKAKENHLENPSDTGQAKREYPERTN